jgi:DNA polymerase-3 subunit delta
MKVDLSYYRRLFKELNVESPATLYLFHGPERFIMEEMAARITESAVSKDLRSFNLTASYGAEVDLESFLSTARSYPFLADRRVLVLKEMERLRGSWDPLIEYCKDPTESSTVMFFFVTQDDRGRRIQPPRYFKKLERAVDAAGRVIRFDSLNERGIRRWTSAKAKKMGITLDETVAAAIVRSVGENLFDIQNELQKLSLLYDGARVSIEDLSTVIGRYRLNAVYELLDVIRPGNEIDALSVLSHILETGAEKPSVILYHLIRHFLALLKVKAGIKGGGYRSEYVKREVDLYSTGHIVLWLENLRITEIIMKSTSFPAETLIFGALLHSMKGRLLDDRFRLHAAA